MNKAMKKRLKESAEQLEYEDLMELLGDNFSDTLDFLRDYADSFSLIYDSSECGDANADLIWNDLPFKDLKSELIAEKVGDESVEFLFKLNDYSAEWLKNQGFSNNYVPGISHPINDRKMMTLALCKEKKGIICLDDGFFDLCSDYIFDKKFKKKLSKYLKKHRLFYKFAESIEKDLNVLNDSGTITKYAVGDYPNLFFMYQFSVLKNIHLPELYSERVVEFCAKVMIERHKITRDEFLFGDLFLWLRQSLTLSVGVDCRVVNNPATGGWQIVRDYILSQDKALVCGTIEKIIFNAIRNYCDNDTYGMRFYNRLIYNCASIFKEIGEPYSEIHEDKAKNVLKYFDRFDLKKHYDLDEGAGKIVGIEYLQD